MGLLASCDNRPRVGPESCACLVEAGDPTDGVGVRFVPEGVCHCLEGERAVGRVDGDRPDVFYVSPDGTAEGAGTPDDPWDTPDWVRLAEAEDPVIRVAAVDSDGAAAVYEGVWSTDLDLAVMIDGGWAPAPDAWVAAHPEAYPTIDGLSFEGTTWLTARHLRLGGSRAHALLVPGPVSVELDDVIVAPSGASRGVFIGPGPEPTDEIPGWTVTVRNSRITAGRGPALSIQGLEGDSSQVTIANSVFVGGRGRSGLRADGLAFQDLAGGVSLNQVVVAGAARGIVARDSVLDAVHVLVASSTDHGILIPPPTSDAGGSETRLRAVTVHGSRGDGVTLDGPAERGSLTVDSLDIFDVADTGFTDATGSPSQVNGLTLVDVQRPFGRGTPAPDSCTVDEADDAAAATCETGAERPTREVLSGPDRVLFTDDDVRQACAPDDGVSSEGLLHRFPFDGTLQDVCRGALIVDPESAAFTADPDGTPDAALAPEGCSLLRLPAEMPAGAATTSFWIRVDGGIPEELRPPLATIGGARISYDHGQWKVELLDRTVDPATIEPMRAVVPDEWVHMAIVWDDTARENRLYLNGEPAGRTASYVPQRTLQTIDAGCFGDHTAFDELRLYSRVLNDAEIAHLAVP